MQQQPVAIKRRRDDFAVGADRQPLLRRNRGARVGRRSTALRIGDPVDNRPQHGHKSDHHDPDRDREQPHHLAPQPFGGRIEWRFFLDVVLYVHAPLPRGEFAGARPLSALGTPDGGAGEARPLRFRATAEDAGERLDRFIAGRMPAHVSRSRVKALIEAGQVELNGAPCLIARRPVAAGDDIALAIPPPDDPQPLPEPIPLDILFEDDHIIVVDKPAGMVVHPAPGNWSGTLVNALLHHCGDTLAGIGGVRRPGIVHRLDKETSGVMVVAKTEAALAGLAAQFADHGRTGTLERAYLALVWGVPSPPSGTIDATLGRDPANRLKRAVVRDKAPDARRAVTHYRVLERLDGNGDGKADAGLVECRLETGRTHQIRVHMAHSGHPLVGDRDYGAHFKTKAQTLDAETASAAGRFRRQALHAALLGFDHPVTGDHMRFEAPLPGDMAELVAAFARLPAKAQNFSQ